MPDEAGEEEGPVQEMGNAGEVGGNLRQDHYS